MVFNPCNNKYTLILQLTMTIVMRYSNDLIGNLAADMLRNYYNIKYLKLL